MNETNKFKPLTAETSKKLILRDKLAESALNCSSELTDMCRTIVKLNDKEFDELYNNFYEVAHKINLSIKAINELVEQLKKLY